MDDLLVRRTDRAAGRLRPVMEARQQIAVWMHDAAAKLFLGLTSRQASRWVIIRRCSTGQARGSMSRSWKNGAARAMRGEVHPLQRQPSQCVIRYDHIITIQNLKDAPAQPADTRPIPGVYL
jgi:hypothetical protein